MNISEEISREVWEEIHDILKKHNIPYTTHYRMGKEN